MPTTFSVMTWNVESLFPKGTTLIAREITPAEYVAKLDYIASRIKELSPDVVGFQEIGGHSSADHQSLDDLQTRLPDYKFSTASAYQDSRGIKVAFLSKLEFRDRADIRSFSLGELSSVPDYYPRPPITMLGRGVLSITVQPAPGVSVRVLTAHLKSKLISYPSSGGKPRFSPSDENERTRGIALALLRRSAEAAALRSHLNHVMTASPGTHTVVMGDLNDEPRAQTTQLIAGPEDADATRDDKLDAVRLYNLMDAIGHRGTAEHDKWFLPPEQRYTRDYLGRHELIDHILVSKGLLGKAQDMLKDKWAVEEVRVLTDSIKGQVISDFPADREGKIKPDHAPVYARFRV